MTYLVKSKKQDTSQPIYSKPPNYSLQRVESLEKTETMAWMECKMAEAMDQLETISLKESVIWKAWVRCKEGLRLAHWQWEIGEAAARMETMGHQPILALKLT